MAIESDARGTLRNGSSALVLLVADLLHPLDRLAVERLLDGDVGHGGGWGGAMPMLLARREDHDVAGANFLDRRRPRAAPGRSPR